MGTLSSTEFRKRFARLKDPTQVTVNGHVIGEWTPVHSARYMTLQEVKAQLASVRQDAELVARTFTPVPKPSQKGR